MFIAHAPSGYLLFFSILKRIQHLPASASATLIAAITGAVAPDLDLLYFYLVDHRQSHHHKYLSHWPLTWLALSVIFAIWLRCSPGSKGAFLAMVVCAGGMLHVILDSFVGDIWWLAPFLDKPFAMFTVPAVRTPWWMNFLLHWSFAAELAICFWALLSYRRRLNN